VNTFSLTGEFIPAALLIALGYLTRGSATVAVVLLALACAVGGASCKGNLSSIVDLSPNFAGRSIEIWNLTLSNPN
jgi:uncharacterized membrane protein YphA (DoxX/SURF4 family)